MPNHTKLAEPHPLISRKATLYADFRRGMTDVLNCCRMGFMEMKRVNQDLVTELQAIHEASALMESKHQNTVDKLTQEIMTTRVST